MLMCAGACVCVWVCVYALRVASTDKVLHFINTSDIIINRQWNETAQRSEAECAKLREWSECYKTLCPGTETWEPSWRWPSHTHWSWPSSSNSSRRSGSRTALTARNSPVTQMRWEPRGQTLQNQKTYNRHLTQSSCLCVFLPIGGCFGWLCLSHCVLPLPLFETLAHLKRW